MTRRSSAGSSSVLSYTSENSETETMRKSLLVRSPDTTLQNTTCSDKNP